jgi:hypothetical protein
MKQVCDKNKKQNKNSSFIIYIIIQTTTMKTRKLEMQYQE